MALMEPDYRIMEAEREPLPEPMHQRVAVLEKRIRELEDRLHAQDANTRDFIERVARELGF